MRLPDTEVGCHRTGFARKCREIVCAGECRRWRYVPYETQSASAVMPDQWACIDDHIFWLALVHGKQLDEATASVDKVATQVAERGTDTLGALARLGHDVRGLSAIAAGAVVMRDAETAAPMRELPSQ